MSTLLFIPAFFIGFPMVIGVWMTGLKLFNFLCARTSKQTAFVVTLCALAALLSLMSAPAWLLGWQGYALVAAVYVGFVAFGAPHLMRVMRFLSLELDSDPNNDVSLPEEESKKSKG